MTDVPLFSVIVVDYDGAVSRDLFRRKMKCLADQTCKDFEVLVYHDGPKQIPYDEEMAGHSGHPATRYIVTEARANDWGHSNRDRGIREAKGTWIVHTNADNVFYPQLIERLKAAALSETPAYRLESDVSGFRRSLGKAVSRLRGRPYRGPVVVPCSKTDILIYAILMRGMVATGRKVRRLGDAGDAALLFGGVPVRKGQIDVMQLVMRRELWLAEGGWYDRGENSDGDMYPALARKYCVRAVPEVLGEHW